MVIFAALLLSTLLDPGSADVRKVGPSELSALLKKGEAVVIDVRGTVPYAYGHIDGALSMPLGMVEKRSSELPQDRLIVAYCNCANEETSLAAAEALRKIGFERTGVLVGGYQAWKDAGLSTRATRQAAAPAGAAPAPAAGRLAPPPAVTCDRNNLTSYSGKVTRYERKPERIAITIATTSDTTESVTVAGMRQFLIEGRPFTDRDWARIESAAGVLRPDVSVHAWVCEAGTTLIDWRPAAH